VFDSKIYGMTLKVTQEMEVQRSTDPSAFFECFTSGTNRFATMIALNAAERQHVLRSIAQLNHKMRFL
jgi:hypothetical protein